MRELVGAPSSGVRVFRRIYHPGAAVAPCDAVGRVGNDPHAPRVGIACRIASQLLHGLRRVVLVVGNGDPADRRVHGRVVADMLDEGRAASAPRFRHDDADADPEVFHRLEGFAHAELKHVWHRLDLLVVVVLDPTEEGEVDRGGPHGRGEHFFVWGRAESLESRPELSDEWIRFHPASMKRGRGERNGRRLWG